MSRIAPPSQKKRRLEEGAQGKSSRPKKKVRKQRNYHSSEDESGEGDDFQPVDVDQSDEEEENISPPKPRPILKREIQAPDSDAESETGDRADDGDESSEDDGDSGVDDDTGGSTKQRTKSKRNDPEAFSTSISKILSTKLSQSVRKDPVLSRSRDAHQAGHDLANERLEKKVKARERAEKKKDLDKARNTDVLGLESGKAGEVAEDEKRLRKIAQRGVVKLFNAVRAAQVRAEQAAKEEQKKGTIGMAKREDKSKEMSKDAFLNMMNGSKSAKPR